MKKEDFTLKLDSNELAKSELARTKAINDAMSFLANAPSLYASYGPGCIETEVGIQKELMEEAGVEQEICNHFEHIVHLNFLID